MNTKLKKNKGFTLIELLVVIAIIAILMVTVVITLNPGQLLAQSRDSNRLSDMATLNTAINLFTADVSTSTVLGTRGTCYSYVVTSTCSWFTLAAGAASDTAIGSATGRKVDGTGWIPVNFSAISAGAPFAQLPIDPSNTATGPLMYSYDASGTSLFKLAAKMESTKFAASGTSDVVSTDGGTSQTTYEIGSGILVL
jgi:prepilin-type N-terminal cleavage/methylation domain-containing protein